MNESNAPKLDPCKIISAISVLIGDENIEQNSLFASIGALQPESVYTSSHLYSAIARTINILREAGVYKYIKPAVNVSRKLFRVLYKIPLFGNLLRKSVRILLKRRINV